MVKLEHEWSDPDQETSLARPVSLEITSPLDRDGVPLVDNVGDWLDLPDRAAGLAPDSELGWLLATLRYSRSDGSPIFGPRGRQAARSRRLSAWASRVGDASLARVAAWWSLKGEGQIAGPASPTPFPVASHSCGDRALAVLRPDWSPRGELIAIDHRTPGPDTTLEVASKGRVWLGPTWSSPRPGGESSAALPTCWTSGPYADCLEWSYRIGETRTIRTAALVKGRGLALLAQQDEGPGLASEARFAIPEGVEAVPDAELRSILLTSGRGKPTARVIPIGLPCSPYATERGSIAVQGRELVVRQASAAGRRWLAILISWERSAASWRTLTVASQSQACPADLAFAARVAWKQRAGGMVIYRSLGPPDLRTFLGHQTRARFLVGNFDASGDVRPILKVD